jgi:hypothetical protein
MASITLCVCTLGALGIDAFGAARLSRHLTRGLAVTAAASGVSLAALLLAPAATEALAIRLLGDAGPFFRSTLATGLPHLVIGLAALIAVDRLRPEPARASALALLVALSTAAAVYYGAHLGSRDQFTTPLRLETDSPAPRLAQPLERAYDPGARRYGAGLAARYRSILLNPAVNVAHRVDTIEPYGAFEPRRLATIADSIGSTWARSFRRFGLTHVAFPVPHDVSKPQVAALVVEGGRLVQREEFLGLGFELWAVPHRPWAFFAKRAVSKERTRDEEMELPPFGLEALHYLIDHGDDATVIVETSVVPPTSPGRILIVDRGTESVRVEAESVGPALLVLQDAYWPGWRASIDGKPVEILAADLLVRAVRWPAGRHRLEMVYDPPELGVGLLLSALGAALVALLALLAARSRMALQATNTATPSADTRSPARTSGGR